MIDRSLKIGAFLLIIGFSALISFAFFCISVSSSQENYKKAIISIDFLVQKVDSLEYVINTSFREKKDTIIINIVPQDVKIYCTKEK